MVDIWWSSGSCPSWRVLLALELKGVPYTGHRLDLSRLQHKTPEILALNPRGKVPIFRDGEVVIYEWIAILAYLERRTPEPPLLGETAAETARAWRLISEATCYLEPAVDALCLPIYRGTALEQADAVRAAAQGVRAELARLETSLSRSSVDGGEAPWLGGDRPSGADLSYVPQIGHILRAAGKPDAERLDLGLAPLDATFPRIGAWWARIHALPGFDRTYPPHWR